MLTSYFNIQRIYHSLFLDGAIGEQSRHRTAAEEHVTNEHNVKVITCEHAAYILFISPELIMAHLRLISAEKRKPKFFISTLIYSVQCHALIA